MKRTSDVIKIMLDEVDRHLKPLRQRRSDLQMEYFTALSREFIAEHKITLEQVETSEGDGKPWFGRIDEFATWLTQHSTKPWAEWNRMLYKTSDLKKERWIGCQTPAQFEHLKKRK